MTRFLLFSDRFPSLWKKIKKQSQFLYSWLLHLPRFYKKPAILFFGSLDEIIIKNGVLILTWETKNSWKAKINGIGKFIFQNSLSINPDFDTKTFTLTAYGYWRKAKSVITIQTLPPLNLQRVLVVIPQRKVKPILKNVLIKKDKLLGSMNLEKILAIKTDLQSAPLKIIIPPFENSSDQLNQSNLLNSSL